MLFLPLAEAGQCLLHGELFSILAEKEEGQIGTGEISAVRPITLGPKSSHVK